METKFIIIFIISLIFYLVYAFILNSYLKSINVEFKIEYLKGMFFQKPKIEWRNKETPKSKKIYKFLVIWKIFYIISFFCIVFLFFY